MGSHNSMIFYSAVHYPIKKCEGVKPLVSRLMFRLERHQDAAWTGAATLPVSSDVNCHLRRQTPSTANIHTADRSPRRGADKEDVGCLQCRDSPTADRDDVPHFGLPGDCSSTRNRTRRKQYQHIRALGRYMWHPKPGNHCHAVSHSRHGE